MKVLFLHTTALLPLQFGVLMDEAKMMYKEGHEVFFGYCNNTVKCCTMNMHGKKSFCDLCTWNTKHALENLPKEVKRIKIKEFIPNKRNEFVKDYCSMDEIKAVEYKGVKIGYGVLSTYLSVTRNNEPVFDKAFNSYINGMLYRSSLLTDAIESIVDTINPDLVCIFNGRLFEHRPMLELPMSKGINVKNYEVLGGYHEEYYKESFENCLPHNIKKYNGKVVELWNNPDVPLEKKIEIGSSFYKNRRVGIPAGDRVYIGKQEAGLLPEGWDDSKRNFVIFNSSEDEHLAVGDEYSSLDFFPSQLVGIKTILSMVKDCSNIHVYLRIHPNLSNIKYSYHTDLYKLEREFSCVTVIPGSAEISTYELMEKSEKVIVFGSSMGLESSFWKKPVINLAGCGYATSGICYMPKNLEELKALLLDKIEPLDNLFSLQFGYFKMHRDETAKYKFIDYNYKPFKLGNKDLTLVNYQKFMGSRHLFAVLQLLVGHYFSKKDKSVPITIPTNGK